MEKKVYGITTLPGDKPVLQEITVLEEGTYAGATVPTMRVRYPDGKTARCSIDLYQRTPVAAIAKALGDIDETLLHLQDEESRIHDEKAKLNALSKNIGLLANRHRQTASEKTR